MDNKRKTRGGGVKGLPPCIQTNEYGGGVLALFSDKDS